MQVFCVAMHYYEGTDVTTVVHYPALKLLLYPSSASLTNSSVKQPSHAQSLACIRLLTIVYLCTAPQLLTHSAK